MKYRVRKRWPAFGLSMVLFFGAVIFWSCFFLIDHQGYKKVLERANPSLAQNNYHPHRATQVRKGVQREIWQLKKNNLLAKTLLKSSRAELVYEKEKGKLAIVENMHDVKCLIQEDLFFAAQPKNKGTSEEKSAFQSLSSMQAKSAKYYYKNGVLKAKDVVIKQYSLPGHQLPQDIEVLAPKREIEADFLKVSFKKKSFHIEGEKVRAFLDKKGVIESPFVKYFENGKVVFFVPEGSCQTVVYHVFLKQQNFEGTLQIHAKKAMLFPDEEKKSKKEDVIVAEGDVVIYFGDKLRATCDTAEYRAGSIFLHRNVKVNTLEFGTLQASDKLCLVIDKDGKPVHLKGFGKIKCQSENKGKGHEFTLECNGEMSFDLQRFCLDLQSYKEEEKQIFYQDGLGKIYSNDGRLEFMSLGKGYVLKRVQLLGNVHLISKEDELGQYALAERAVYKNEEELLHLTGTKGKRVLIYDKLNNLQMSAPEIKIQRDKTTKKERFQGIGDVRLLFSEKEFEQIRKHFSLGKNKL